jgi:hypothetical protein
MRLIAILVMALNVSVANVATAPDFYGIWVSDLTRCDFGGPTTLTRVVLNVTGAGNRLDLVEVDSDEAGASIAHRRYEFGRPLGQGGTDAGTARAADAETILQNSDRLERWTVSGGGSELTVKRWVGGDPATRPLVLVFRRSDPASW